MIISSFISAILFAGCGADAAGEAQTEPSEAGEDISKNTNSGKGNGIKEDSQEKGASDENDAADNQEKPSDKTNIYDRVLAEYSDMVQNDFYMDLRDSDSYDSSFGEDIGLEIRTHKQDVYYAFYDIDGNGTMELMIAGGENSVSNPTFSPWNYDLYGYDGNHAVHIFPEMAFGYRTNFSLHENGVIEVFYSSSAADSGIDFYRIGSDGFTPELVDSFATAGHLEGEEPVFAYFQNGNEITEEEYTANIQRYEATLAAKLDWKKIQ